MFDGGHMHPLQTHSAVPESAISCSVSCGRAVPQKTDLNPLTLVPMVFYSPTSSTFSSCHSFIHLIPFVTNSFLL